MKASQKRAAVRRLIVSAASERAAVVGVKRQFYVGHPRVVEAQRNDNWGKTSLDEAVAHARQRVEQTGETQYVVKVIRVVRPQKVPVLVEVVG